MNYLALCCIAKNETPFLREWVAYHALLGVEHFFIYDNMSERAVSDVLGPYVPPDRVTIRRIHGKAKQMEAYEHCLAHGGADYFWLGFLDLDEFVCTFDNGDKGGAGDLRSILGEFEAYASLGLSWRVFSSNGHLRRPSGLVISNYTAAFCGEHTSNMQIKSFVQTARIAGTCNPHFCRLKAGECAVTEHHEPIPPDSAFTPASHRRVWINHYFYKSQQDYEARLRRGNAATPDPAHNNVMEAFYRQLNLAVEEETTIMRYAPLVKKSMGQKSLPPVYIPPAGRADELVRHAQTQLENGQLDHAAVTLCYAGIQQADSPELWTLRARVARLAGEYTRAGAFVRRALRCALSPFTYLEQIHLCHAQRQGAEALHLVSFLYGMLQARGEMTPYWQRALEHLEVQIRGTG